MRNGVKEFGKAQVSSLVSTACDFVMTALVFELTRHVVGSTISGAVTGGMMNCFINYLWTFRGTHRSKRGIIWRYVIVWIGSVILNTTGTEYGVKGVTLIGEAFEVTLSQNLSILLIVKAVVAVVVAVCWNFFMQKYYVYPKKRHTGHQHVFHQGT